MWAMELNSIECMSYTDGMEDDDPAAPAQLPHPFLKSAATASAVVATVASDHGGGAGAGLLVPPATGVHELLECPVCLSLSHGGDDETGDGGGETRQSLAGRCAREREGAHKNGCRALALHFCKWGRYMCPRLEAFSPATVF
jgi:hypothetical protein